jgi:RimJ/RimL family protein N-acetyltransferase
VYQGPTPPYRIETERLVLRCWEPADAPALDAAVAESRDELRVWMPWAAVPAVEPTVELLRRFRGSFDLGQEFSYGIFDHAGAVIGSSGLHVREDEGAFEIGYWVRTGRTREGLATEAAAALTCVGMQRCGAQRMDIRVEPGNEASARVARKLGYREEGRLRRKLPPLVPGGPMRDALLFTLLAEELPASACASTAYRAFDVVGNSLTA